MDEGIIYRGRLARGHLHPPLAYQGQEFLEQDELKAAHGKAAHGDANSFRIPKGQVPHVCFSVSALSMRRSGISQSSATST